MANYLPPQFSEELAIATGDAAEARVDGVANKQHRFVGAIVSASTAGSFTITCGPKILVEDFPVAAGATVTVGPFKGVGAGAGAAGAPATGEIKVVCTGIGAGGRASLIYFTHPEG